MKFLAGASSVTPLSCQSILEYRDPPISFADERDDNIYALLTKREIKMAGYWPSSFLRFYGPRRSRGP